MKIAIMGAGGTGAYYGAYLADAGQDVTFIARGAHLQAIQQNGLRLTGSRGDVHINPAQATDDPAAVGVVDVVLFCVKLYDTETVAELIRPMIGPNTLVISVQNGVDGAERIAKVIGKQHALAGSAYVSARIREPGVVSYTSEMSSLVFGEADGKHNERALAFADICQQAGFKTEVSDNINKTLWSKFVLLGTNASLCCLTRQYVAEIYADHDLRRLGQDMMQEIVTVAAAKGIALDDDLVERMVKLSVSFPADMTTSMHHDLNAGKPLELASFSGLIARLGDELNVPTPLHRMAYACLKPYQHGQS